MAATHTGRRLITVSLGALAGVLLTLSATRAQAASPVGFAAPVFVDTVKAGGEPGIIHSTKAGDLVYSSHEGTTHIDRTGVVGTSVVQFLCPNAPTVDCYKNHVWIWTSDDRGQTWQARDQGLSYQGFSDPDLTQDAAGTVYNTGIDLANQSLFSSPDGGKTWPTGTVQCHEGDRPWLAGGRAGQVWMGTDSQVSRQHIVAFSSDYGASCMSTTITDAGTLPDGTTWSGFGKLVYDPVDASIVEPAVFTHPDATVGVGISRLANAAAAFTGGGGTFVPQEVAHPTSVFSPFGAPEVLSMDASENLYFAWDTDERDPAGTAGCSQTVPNQSGGPTPLPNRILFEAGTHIGPGRWAWAQPLSLANQGNARVLWPWSVVGTPGNVSVVWYQMDRMVDPDCGLYNGQAVPASTVIEEARITNATDPGARQVAVTNASGRAVHQGGICNSGTTCVATGQDRRLGDYFTNSIDANGCVLIASGDTTVPDAVTGQPRVTSLPIFIQQTSGPSLTGGQCAPAAVASPVSAPSATAPAPSSPAAVAPGAGIPNTAAGAAAGAVGVGVLGILGGAARAGRRRRAGQR